MQDKKFVSILQKVAVNDENATYEIIQMNEGLIFKNSYVNGIYDEDCRAYIKVSVITAMKKFKI